MAITKEVIVGRIEVVGPHKHVQVRTDTILKEDGEELSRAYHRHVLECGTILANESWRDTDISGEDSQVRTICNTMWTQAIKDSFQAHLITEKNKLPM
jgi:hypothetical protein